MHFGHELMQQPADFSNVHNFFVKLPQTHGIPFETIMMDADTMVSVFSYDMLAGRASPKLTELIADGWYMILYFCSCLLNFLFL